MNIVTKLAEERRARLAELKEAKLRKTNTAPSIIRYIHIYPDIY